MLATDDTLAIATRFPNVHTVQRPFDTHAEEWRFAVEQTGMRASLYPALPLPCRAARRSSSRHCALEAIDCFPRTKMDVLVLGDTLIRR